MNNNSQQCGVSRNDFPILMEECHIESIFGSRTAAYRLMNREDFPVIQIGRRKYVNRDGFFEWLARNTRGAEN